MKTYLECIPCFFEQALRAGRIATDDERKLKHLMEELGKKLSDISLESTPPEIGRLVYRMVREITGNSDPFREIKRESTQKALTLYPRLKAQLKESGDRLLSAVKIAIAGNVIDFGPTGSFDIDTGVNEVLGKDFAICDYSAFREGLTASRSVLYIGDNAGETVFDKLLIEQLNKPVMYVVRETPVINDATSEDAAQAGIDEVATVVSSGTDAPGTIPAICSAEFRQLLDESEFVIAKGQGNYEGLSNANHTIFFLLRAKCRLIARDLNVSEGDIVLKGINV
jgi:uncharacterized protein with ATP-grasp and redox domains